MVSAQRKTGAKSLLFAHTVRVGRVLQCVGDDKRAANCAIKTGTPCVDHAFLGLRGAFSTAVARRSSPYEPQSGAKGMRHTRPSQQALPPVCTHAATWAAARPVRTAPTDSQLPAHSLNGKWALNNGASFAITPRRRKIPTKGPVAKPA